MICEIGPPLIVVTYKDLSFQVKISHFIFPVPEPVSARKRWRSLSCPGYCPKDVDPVCGTDGIIYKNDCELRKRTCNRGEKYAQCAPHKVVRVVLLLQFKLFSLMAHAFALSDSNCMTA